MFAESIGGHEAGLADFHILVEIRRGDGEKFDPFKQRIGGVFSFFENAAIELHPRVVASGKELLFLLRSSHLRKYKPCWQVYSVCRETGIRGRDASEIILTETADAKIKDVRKGRDGQTKG